MAALRFVGSIVSFKPSDTALTIGDAVADPVCGQWRRPSGRDENDDGCGAGVDLMDAPRMGRVAGHLLEAEPDPHPQQRVEHDLLVQEESLIAGSSEKLRRWSSERFQGRKRSASGGGWPPFSAHAVK